MKMIQKSEKLANHYDDKIEAIISSAKNQLQPSHLSDIFDKFISQFYSIYFLQALEELEVSLLAAWAIKNCAFIAHKNPATPKITLTSDDKYSIIQIINDDSPFLLDSIKEELTRHDIDIQQMIHPVINIKRDDQGNLVDIMSRTETDEAFLPESIIFLRVSQLSADQSAALEASILNILANVIVAVQDWRPMIKELEDVTSSISHDPDSHHETTELLRWLSRANFTFLGFIEYQAGNPNDQSTLGILRLDSAVNQKIFDELRLTVKNCGKKQIEIGQIDCISTVHRHNNLDFVFVNYFNDNQTTSTKCFIGLFTSILAYQSISLIPLIRQKAAIVIEKSGFDPRSYSGKELMSVMESLPRNLLFQIDVDNLYQMSLSIYGLLLRPKLKLFLEQESFGNSISCLVCIPKDRFSTEITEKIKNLLHHWLGGTTASQNIIMPNLSVSYVYTVVNTSSKQILAQDIEKIEAQLQEIIRAWDDDLLTILLEQYDKKDGQHFYKLYKEAFPLAYKEQFLAKHAVQDIVLINKALKSQNTIFDLYKSSQSDENGIYDNLKIYSTKAKIALAEIMPILENMGFNAIDESIFYIELPGQHIWVHNFQIAISGYETQSISESKEYTLPEGTDIKRYVEDALYMLHINKMQNDPLNKLILRAGIAWPQVVCIRAIGKYIRQTGFSYSNDYIDDVLTRYPKLVKLMIELFYYRFDPKQQRTEKGLQAIEKTIEQMLGKVISSAEDKVIRRFFDIIRAMLRTNYFIPGKDYLSFKLASAKVPELPLPKPYAEIFVYSSRVEGIHLRGGKVARGGLRWSDRSEDFRTEVLGLMKAQMTKNAVIVPVGSKGGFVVKQSLAIIGRAAYLQEGKDCYQIFLSGLLDLTDNIVNNQVVPPAHVVRYDQDDPYLVVAADKGTATFSDLANSVSAKYNFWLGDAFASGGSAGYDHKKMGITAKGAWIAVERHFRELGIDTTKQDFTVVGIGDMAGDVFGNGMLCSEHIQLIAAFNHLHIFIDPAPDSNKSYAERLRLFKLTGSNWTDYNQSLISAGGGVFERSAKTILLSSEIRQRFDIEEESLSPDVLINKILAARVDLLWNGGIGTYVKSSVETHQQVGDKSNDALRIDANQLRSKIIAEGGNLGFTQRGRVEYAAAGGKVNTDYIDNSAGVDCSDHEVNIKIALQKLIEAKALTYQERDQLLEQMTEEVAQLVLRDNQLQTQAITVMELQGHNILQMQARLIDKLEASKILNREVEFLPSNAELNRRHMAKLGLTRPEIAVLLSYSKLTIYEDLIKSDLPDDKHFAEDLLLYFPKAMQQKFPSLIAEHPLRREIIATSVANSIVNRLGTFFYHFALEDTGLKGSDIARAYTIARDAFKLRPLWIEIEKLSSHITSEEQVALFIQANKLLQRCIFWFLRNSSQTLDVKDTVTLFEPAIKELSLHLEASLVGRRKLHFQNKLAQYASLPADFAKKMAQISILAAGCDIVSVASKSNLPIEQVAKIYFAIGDRFQLDFLREAVDKIAIDGYWDRMSMRSIKDGLYDAQRALTSKVVKFVKKDGNPIEHWAAANQKQVECYDIFIMDLLSQDAINQAMVVVASKRVNGLIAPVT